MYSGKSNFLKPLNDKRRKSLPKMDVEGHSQCADLSKGLFSIFQFTELEVIFVMIMHFFIEYRVKPYKWGFFFEKKKKKSMY